MKTLVVTFILLLLVLQLPALTPASNYVVAGNQVYYGERIYPGFASFRLVGENGELMKFATVSVDAYMINGKLYESKPIMTPAGESAGYAFMEFLSERSGYRLYRYCSNCGKFDPATGQIAPENFRYCYYLYKDSIMCHMFCTSRAKALLKYFGVSVFI